VSKAKIEVVIQADCRRFIRQSQALGAWIMRSIERQMGDTFHDDVRWLIFEETGEWLY
jgi:hypothetical protein